MTSPIAALFAHRGDIPHPFVELVGDLVRPAQRFQEIVRRQDELNLKLAHAIADVEHALPQHDLRHVLAVKNGIKVSARHYSPPAAAGTPRKLLTFEFNAGFTAVPNGDRRRDSSIAPLWSTEGGRSVAAKLKSVRLNFEALAA